MAFMEWETSYQLGVQPFDEHHRHLVGLLNRTYDDFTANADEKSLGLILDELVDYVAYHFKAEEEWISGHHHPQTQQHCEAHEKFTQRVLQIQSDFHDGKTVMISVEILFLLKTWLTEHILKVDAKYYRDIMSAA